MHYAVLDRGGKIHSPHVKTLTEVLYMRRMMLPPKKHEMLFLCSQGVAWV